LGLERAGFDIRACVERDPLAVQTVLRNRSQLRTQILEKDIRDVKPTELLRVSGLRRGEAALVSGGPPCTPFSTAGRRRSVSSKDGQLFQSYLDLVWAVHPKFFIFENVKGILSAALWHLPLNRRRNQRAAPGGEKARLGSGWEHIKEQFDRTLRAGRNDGYRIHVWQLNAADFGSSQVRRRVFIVGSRGGFQVQMPTPTVTNWRPLRDVIGHLNGHHEIPRVDYMPYDKVRFHVFSERLVGPGENWRALPTYWRKKVMGHAYESWGGRVGFARRLTWEQPAPTVTTNPRGRATNLCHPAKPRPLTVTECALLQGFPEDWVFAPESPSRKYIQVGNAVTVELAEAIGRSLVISLQGRAATS
jgi:DNA (cytosine-5)-methyltransferase 1